MLVRFGIGLIFGFVLSGRLEDFVHEELKVLCHLIDFFLQLDQARLILIDSCIACRVRLELPQAATRFVMGDLHYTLISSSTCVFFY